MLIDSHAHYTHRSFQKPVFRYLRYDENGYALAEANQQQLFQELDASGICCTIEPGITLASCREILALCKQYPGRFFPAIGLHPTRSIQESWGHRKQLALFSQADGVIAIGETGLDYHYSRPQQKRLRQHIWFLYQLRLACRRKLPVILHVRDAHRDALRILKWHPARKLGGVVHCFNGDWTLAQQYLQLGYYVGIGGALLQSQQRSQALQEAVAQIPLDRILLETDAPYIHPDCRDVLPGKALRKSQNTSLILPAVVEKIAQLKGISPEAVARATVQNTIRLFRLPINLP